MGPEVGAEEGTKGAVGGDIGVPAGALRDDRRREPLALGAPSPGMVLVPQPWEGPRSLRTIPSTTRNSRENLGGGDRGGGRRRLVGKEQGPRRPQSDPFLRVSVCLPPPWVEAAEGHSGGTSRWSP